MTQENEIPEGCMAFDLEKALAGWPVVTREGLKILQITHFDKLKKPMIVVGYEDDKICGHNLDGKHYYADESDLFIKKKTKTYYANVYRDITGRMYIIISDKIQNPDENESINFLKRISFELDEPESEKKTKTLWIAIRKENPNETFVHTYQQKSNLIDSLISNGRDPINYNLAQVEVECE